MTIPDPSRPTSGMDPMPSRRPRAPLPGDPPDDIPDPTAPGRRDEPTRRREGMFVAVGKDDGRRHVVEVPFGEAGDPTGLRARCGAPVEQVVPGLRAEQADCPECRLRGSSAASPH
ncbi:hypothetical protein [Actinomycetospora termitidis]|uniref:Uncharacterized protein n=1 Tax=Actinomycetospora termitidis TaxID=3053470 RepID=A0ABT7M8H0_9PSEU|nr:hypothetical protein [Actinomycetospora sp. Odt1-22]MDL5155728.1 hypothetical protein [Actinomycetospora sp. Odt1-22]